MLNLDKMVCERQVVSLQKFVTREMKFRHCSDSRNEVCRLHSALAVLYFQSAFALTNSPVGNRHA